MQSRRRFLAPALLTGALVPAVILLSLPSLRPSPAAAPTLPPEPAPAGVAAASDTAVFAGGCFWGVEAVFEHLAGVTTAVSGYAGGSVRSPSYEEVSSGTTGHAEAVLVVYDPSRISYDQLLQVFFTVAHDPTQRDRQGPDVGTQYRSAVFYRSAAQREAAVRYIAKVEEAKVYREAVATEVTALVINDAPKLEELRRRYPALYRPQG